jgi:hypothetical protein
MNPFEIYYNRYQDLKKKLEKNYSFENEFSLMIENEPVQLNNFLMAGLGLGTLFLRMGAIIQLCEKMEKFKPDSNKSDNASFYKIVADNLIYQLPADGNWMNIWEVSMEKGSLWDKKTINSSDKTTPIYKSFVNFRNNIVHEKLKVKVEHGEELAKGLKIVESMASLIDFFKDAEINEKENKLFFKMNNEINLHPYVKVNKNNLTSEVGVLPYLFQGAINSNSKFIGTNQGDETEFHQDAEITSEFLRITNLISSLGSDKVFDHSKKIASYLDCFVGRDEELKAVFEWIESDSNETMLEIYSVAGMGKGAFLAGIIGECEKREINQLYHFCESGLANNLQAVLVHFMNQAAQKSYLNSVFSAKPYLKEKITRFQTKYTDAIRLFQDCLQPLISEKDLLRASEIKNLHGKFTSLVKIAGFQSKSDTELIKLIKEVVLELKKVNQMNDKYYSYLFDLHDKLELAEQPTDLLELIPENKRNHSEDFKRPLVIILDGLDEAAVANAQLRFTDWFYKYNDKDEKEEKWQTSKNIKWIVSYRHDENNPKIGYQFEKYEFNTKEIKAIQPLKGLNEDAVKLALTFEDYKPSQSYLNTVISKAKVHE